MASRLSSRKNCGMWEINTTRIDFLVYSEVSAMDILPEAAIDILPFSAEPILQWNEKADLSQF